MEKLYRQVLRCSWRFLTNNRKLKVQENSLNENPLKIEKAKKENRLFCTHAIQQVVCWCWFRYFVFSTRSLSISIADQIASHMTDTVSKKKFVGEVFQKRLSPSTVQLLIWGQSVTILRLAEGTKFPHTHNVLAYKVAIKNFMAHNASKWEINVCAQVQGTLIKRTTKRQNSIYKFVCELVFGEKENR